MELREVMHQLVDYGGRWLDEDGQRGIDAHAAVERYFTHPNPPCGACGSHMEAARGMVFCGTCGITAPGLV
jgi:hypothetical protein